jgi:hypothetical protein
MVASNLPLIVTQIKACIFEFEPKDAEIAANCLPALDDWDGTTSLYVDFKREIEDAAPARASLYVRFRPHTCEPAFDDEGNEWQLHFAHFEVMWPGSPNEPNAVSQARVGLINDVMKMTESLKFRFANSVYIMTRTKEEVQECNDHQNKILAQSALNMTDLKGMRVNNARNGQSETFKKLAPGSYMVSRNKKVYKVISTGDEVVTVIRIE